MSIHSINHAQLGFPAGKHVRVRHFHGELVGLPETGPGDGKTLRFHAEAQRIDLVLQAWRSQVGMPHLALQLENLPGLRARLLDAGLALDESRALPGHLHFYVRDPAGNALEFLEPVAGQKGAA